MRSDVDLFLRGAGHPLPLDREREIGLQLRHAREDTRRILLGGPGGLALVQWRLACEWHRKCPRPERLKKMAAIEGRVRALLTQQVPPRYPPRRARRYPVQGQVRMFTRPCQERVIRELAPLKPTPHELRGLEAMYVQQADHGLPWALPPEDIRANAATLRAHAETTERGVRLLTRHNLRLVVTIVRDFQRAPTFEVLAEGAIGLMDAARRFDPDRVSRFSAYARTWVRKRVFEALSEHHADDPGWTPIEEMKGLADPSPALDDRPELPLSIADLRDRLAGLSEEHRHALTLRYGLDEQGSRSWPDVARGLNASVHTATRLVSEALEILRRR